MFCPRCRSEYRAGYTRCAHCEVELVAELPPVDLFESPEAMAKALEGKETKAVLVGGYVDLLQAQRFLGSERIASVLAGEADQEIEAPLHQRLYLMVGAEDLDRARDAVHRRWREGAIAEGLMRDADAPTTVDACPACGAAVPAQVSECPECGLFLGEAGAEKEGSG